MNDIRFVSRQWIENTGIASSSSTDVIEAHSLHSPAPLSAVFQCRTARILFRGVRKILFCECMRILPDYSTKRHAIQLFFPEKLDGRRPERGRKEELDKGK